MKRKRHLWISVSMIALGLVGLLGLSFARTLGNPFGIRTAGYYGGGLGWPSMMGEWRQGGVQALTTADANRATKSSLVNATVDKANNSITYRGKSIRIVLIVGAMDGSNTGPAEKFIVAGLINPTLQVPKGSQVTLELINDDTDMPHGVEVSAVGPPYAAMMMMQGRVYPDTYIAPIPEAASGRFPMSQTTFMAAETGTFYYLCQYPGHASEGMYGKLVIA